LKKKPLLVHFHMHHRKTGVTSSVENVLPFLQKDFDTYVYGNQVFWDHFLSLKELKKKLREYDQIIIHAHRNKEIQQALWLRFLGYRFKLIVSRHAATKPSKFTLWLMKKADVRIGLIDSMKELPFEISIIGHGVDTKRFVPKENIKISQIKQPHFMVVAGRVRPKKGHETFVKAFIPILKEHPDWAGVIIGKVDDQKFVLNLRKLIAENKLENQFYFIEETRAIEEWYQASKATVVPSHSEGFSLVCLEAMACESICVATKDVGVHSNVIEDSKTGFLFEAGNHNELTSILNAIVSDNHQISNKEARTYIEENWSAQKEADALKEVYLRSINKS